MIPAELKLALRQMGYRHMVKDVWGKPVGYHLLTVHVAKNGEVVLTNSFKGENGKIHVWNTYVLVDEHYLASLKWAERESPAKMYHASTFEFLTPEELYADLL